MIFFRNFLHPLFPASEKWGYMQTLPDSENEITYFRTFMFETAGRRDVVQMPVAATGSQCELTLVAPPTVAQ